MEYLNKSDLINEKKFRCTKRYKSRGLSIMLIKLDFAEFFSGLGKGIACGSVNPFFFSRVKVNNGKKETPVSQIHYFNPYTEC